MDDEFTCTATEEAAKVKIFLFSLMPTTKYRLENIHLGRKNSVFSAWSKVQVGFTKYPFEFRTLSDGYLTPAGSTAYAAVPTADYQDYDPKPIPEGAIQLFIAFWNPVTGDKMTVNLNMRIL